MSYAFSLPDFTPATASEEALYSYLYRTVEQLNYVVGHLSGSGGGSAAVLLPGQTPAQALQKDSRYAELKSLILKSADVVNAFYDQISARLRGSYVARSDFGTYLESTSLEIEGTPTDIRQIFTRIEALTDLVEGLEAGGIHTSAYIKSGLLETAADGTPVYGLEVGQTNQVNGEEVFSKFARFTSGRVSFYDRNDTEVGYISDYKLYITHAQITGSLTLGGFAVDLGEGIAFRWIGGEA